MAVYPNYKDTEYIDISSMTVDNTLKFIPDGMGQDAQNVLLLDKQVSALWINQMAMIDEMAELKKAQAEDDKIRPTLLFIGKWGGRVFSKVGILLMLIITTSVGVMTTMYIETHMADKEEQIESLKNVLEDEGLVEEDYWEEEQVKE